MKTFLALAAIALAPAIASAHYHHPVVQELTCADAQAMVAEAGGYFKVTGTGDVVPMYPVYSDGVVCNNGSYAGRVNHVFESTLDNPSCFLGYRCPNK